MTYWTEEKRRDSIAAMRKICDLLEENPELMPPSGFSGPVIIQCLNEADPDTREERQAWFERQAAVLLPLGAKPQVVLSDQLALLIDINGVVFGVMGNINSLCDKQTINYTERVVHEPRTEEVPVLTKSLLNMGFEPSHIQEVLKERAHRDEERYNSGQSLRR
jgi:hypothetical protein